MIKRIFIILLSIIVLSLVGIFLTIEVFDYKNLHNSSYEQLLKISEIYHRLGINYKSIKFAGKAIEMNPDIIDAYVYKAEAMKPNQAKIFIEDVVLKKFPNEPVLYFHIATINYRQNNLNTALKILNEFVEKYSTLAEVNDLAYVHFLSGKCYAAQYNFEKAVESFSKTIELNPNYDEAYILRAKANGDMGLWDKTLTDYEFLKKKYPKSVKYHFLTSLYKINTKDYKGALEDTDKAIELSGKEEAYLYANKAWIYLEMKDYENSKEYLKQALQIDKNDKYANELVAYLAYETKNYKAAIKASNASIKSYDNAAVLVMRAKSFYKLGNKKEAIKVMDKVISIVPYDTEYKEIKEKIINNQEVD